MLQKFLALSLLFVGTAFATSIGGFGEIVHLGGDIGVEPFLGVNQNLPLLRSAPGVVRPEYVSSYDEVIPHHDEYGVPEVPHEEYGPPPEPHEEYGPPPVPVERIIPVVTTEQ